MQISFPTLFFRSSLLSLFASSALIGVAGGCGGEYVSLGRDGGAAGETQTESGSGGATPGAGRANAGAGGTAGAAMGGATMGGATMGGASTAGSSEGGAEPGGSGGVSVAGYASGGTSSATCGTRWRPMMSVEECQAAGAEMIGDPGSGGLLESGCPYGVPALGEIPGSFEGMLCCPRLDVLSVAACEALGSVRIEPTLVPQTGCPEGRRLRGTIRPEDGSGVCCERLPRVDVNECVAQGNELVDYMLSSYFVYGEGCSGERRSLGEIRPTIEPQLCCENPKLISVEECIDRGGGVLADPGNGCTRRDGCPDRRTWLGNLGAEVGDEGGICCELP